MMAAPARSSESSLRRQLGDGSAEKGLADQFLGFACEPPSFRWPAMKPTASPPAPGCLMTEGRGRGDFPGSAMLARTSLLVLCFPIGSCKNLHRMKHRVRQAVIELQSTAHAVGDDGLGVCGAHFLH